MIPKGFYFYEEINNRKHDVTVKKIKTGFKK
jgi:hypothetical protein